MIRKFWHHFTATAEDMDVIIKQLNPKKVTGIDATLPKVVTISENVIDSHVANINSNTVPKYIFSKNAKTATIRPSFKRKGCEELEIVFEKYVKIWNLKLFFKNL